MKKLSASVVASLILVSTFTVLPLVKADSSEVKKLSVPYMYQGQTQWCFLNSLSMVMQYYGVRVHAWELAETWNLGHDEGTGNILQELIEQNVVNFVESKGLTCDTPVVGGTWNFDFYKSHIDSAEPIVVCGYSVSFQIWNNGGHAVVVVGYKSNSTGDYLLVHDPSGFFVDDEWGDWTEAAYPYMYAVVPWTKFLEYFENFLNLLIMYDIVIHGTAQPPEGILYLQDNDIYHTGSVNPSNDGHLYLGDSFAWTDGLDYTADGEEILPNERVVVAPCVANQYSVQKKYKVRTTLDNIASGQNLVSLVKAQTVQAQKVQSPILIIDLSKIARITPGAYGLTISLWEENADFQTDTPYDVLGPFRLTIASSCANTDGYVDVFQDVEVMPAGGILTWTVDIYASVKAYLHSSSSGWYWSLYADAFMVGANNEVYRDTGKTDLEFKVNAYNPSGEQIYAGSWTSTDEDGDGIDGDFSHLGGGTPSVQCLVSSLSSLPEYIVLKTKWRIYDEFWWPIPNIWKESNEVEVARIYRTLSGGPDSFGYSFTDSNAPSGPTYNWIEISGTGSVVLPSSDDQWVTGIGLGFFFNYYGTDYSMLAIGNNGLLFSGVGTSQYVNQPITQTPNIHGFIAPFWDDIVTWGSAGAIYYETQGTSPNREFIVEWYDNQHYYSSTSGITFEAILYEGTNNILFQYKDVDFGSVYGSTGSDLPPYNNGGSATVGIEDPTGNIGLKYSYNQQFISPELAILFKFPAFAGTNMYLSMNAPASMDHGNTMTYTMYYNDFGDVAAQNVALQIALSPNVDFVSASDSGTYDAVTRKVTWSIGTVSAFPSGRGTRTVTVTIPASVSGGTIIQATASISTSTAPETRYDDNSASAQTTVTGSNLPPNVSVGPTLGNSGGTPSVYWSTPIAFTYYDAAATGVDIRIHLDDGGSDMTASMTGGPPTWTYTVTFYPRHGHATVTYIVHYPGMTSQVSFNIYVDPAGYVYNVVTLQRVSGASVWLQRSDGQGGWENVPTGQTPPIMQPDVNPQITGTDGQYQWDVLEGSYRVHVEASGYYPADSIMVNIPPPVTDLHVGLTPLPSPDPLPPTTTLAVGDPKYIDLSDNVYVTSDTPFTLSAEDNVDGSGVAVTGYRIYNATYDSGWTASAPPIEFYFAGLADGAYFIDFNSTDNVGNIETTHAASVSLDNSGPSIVIENPPAGWALQDGVTFIALSTDLSGTHALNFSVREANGDQGIPVGFEDIPVTYNAITGKWEWLFDTLQLPDGYYVVLVEAEDNLGHTTLIIVPYSIRNWAVLELLPASENNKAGRTMPVKFALRVAAAVDPNQPFVYNEELTIRIYATDNPSNILQTSTFGDAARDYRINTLSEKYITNFQTLNTRKTYMVEVWRKDMLIDTFGFQTVK